MESERTIKNIKAALGRNTNLMVKKELSGKSGATIFLIDLITSDFSGPAILKYETFESSSLSETEAESHEKAINVSSSFATNHIPMLICSGRFDNYCYELFSVAADGLENCRTLAECPSLIHKKTCENVSEDILKVWNINSTPKDTLQSESEILSRWLGHRIDSNKDGRMEPRLKALGISKDQKSFSYCGLIFPNPLYWCTDDNLCNENGIRPTKDFCMEIYIQKIFSLPSTKARKAITSL